MPLKPEDRTVMEECAIATPDDWLSIANQNALALIDKLEEPQDGFEGGSRMKWRHHPGNIVVDETGQIVADVYLEDTDAGRLIAAAPELLAACQALSDYQREYESNAMAPDRMPGTSLYSDEAMKVVRMARAAIKAATR